MIHFLNKNINNLQGAGGGGSKGGGGAPPPAQLLPPKLGKLQTLASYSYAEIIDLVSDGPIEGFVNQNGQYVHGARIFESIYLEDTPIKKSFDVAYTGSNFVEVTGYSLTTATSSVSGLWYRSGQYVANSFPSVRAVSATGSLTGNAVSGLRSAIVKTSTYFSDDTKVNDPYTSLTYAPISHTGNSGNIFSCPDPYVRNKEWEITWTRNDIAKSIYKGIDLLKNIAASPTTFGEDASDIAASKILQYNYQNWNDVKDSLLPYYLNENESDYPIFAIKFEIGSPFRETIYSECGNPLAHYDVNEKQATVGADFTLDSNTNIVLTNDIANQVFDRIELEDINSKRPIQPIRYLDLTYATKTTSTNIDMGGCVIAFGFKNGSDAPTKESIDAIRKYIESVLIVRPDNEKYNYSNILAEIREGGDLQTPLSYFQKVYFDIIYGIILNGPFDVSNQVLRVTNFDDSSGYKIKGAYEFPLAGTVLNEGSSDTRSNQSFSSYAGNNRTQFIESAVPITHTIENPNVNQVYLTLGVRALNDTNQVDASLPGIGSVQAGSNIPAAVRFKVEIGLQDSFGKDIPSSIEERIYQIVGMIQTAALVDIGRAEVSNILNDYKFLSATRGNSEINASTELILPAVTGGAKRFVRVTRTTYETSSVLLKRQISLEKVTEVINTKFSYPGSAIIGVKIDSRTSSNIPRRSYDLRLKKILVPSNYYPLAPDGKDRRRYKTATEFNAATADDLQIYKGNWDGTFKLAWTDNPAWVLFDILINPHYGLGSFMDASQINIWELYKIGRFSDGVDKNGVFKGVDNPFGGKEPRYSINIILADKINVFDTLNAIATVFRGTVFYSNSYIDFTDDRLKLPIMDFSNTNVKDGVFSYANSRLDEEFNVAEVSYLDENDNFKPKIAYVENSDDIRKRGILSIKIDSFGITSYSLANRIGQHVIYATTNENQAVSFVGGTECLFLKPGDLITINDELKTQQRNFGRVLDIDPDSGKVYINEKFPINYALNEITLLAPTGIKSFDEMLGIARASGGITFKDIHESDIPQVQTFKISGYDNSIEYGSNIYIKPKTEYDLITMTGIASGSGVYSGNGTVSGYTYYTSAINTGYYVHRGSNISGTDDFWSLKSFASTGAIYSGASDQLVPYSGSWNNGGCIYTPTFDNSNIEFLGRVKQGFPFGITMSGMDIQTYKVSSIREGGVNEYEVSAIKFNTGKFAIIENTQNLNDFYDTFSFVGAQSATPVTNDNLNAYQLDSPTINLFSTGNYDSQSDALDISGSWGEVNGASSYLVNVIAPNGQKTTLTTTGYNHIVYDQTQLGFYRLLVTAKNPSLGYTSKTVSSGINVFSTSSFITPYIKDISLN